MPAQWPLQALLLLLLARAVAGLRLGGDGPGDPAEDARESREGSEQFVEQYLGQRVANPAGCANVNSKERSLDRLQGVYPVEDFQTMLSHEFADRTGGRCQEKIRKVRWCPAPTQEPYLGRHSKTFQALKPYLAGALEGTDASLPLTVAVLDLKSVAGSLANSSKAVQVLNFICGWERLGLLEGRSAIFATTKVLADELRGLNPRLRVLYHPHMWDAVSLISQKTGLHYANRVWKMAVAKLLLNLGRDVLLTDMDVYSVRDPAPMLHEAALREGLEFAAMQDCCWLELNSGFLYYRNTRRTARMLEISLTTWREPSLRGCADNDQYLLNCGFARAAADGLKYRILPPTDFAFGSQPNVGGRLKCHASLQAPNVAARWLGDGLPYVWHTSGFTGTYDREMDMLAALGGLDVDPATGRCLAGTRGSRGDATSFANTSARSCHQGSGGILHAGCYGDCMQPPRRAQALKRDISQARRGAS